MGVLDLLIPQDRRLEAQAASFRRGGFEYFLDVMSGSDPTRPDGTFVSMVRDVHKKSGVVSAAVVTRALLMSSIRFAWKHEGHSCITGDDMDPTPTLRRLNRPGSMTRSQMLWRSEVDDSYAGNAYIASGQERRNRDQLFRLDPSRCTFAFGSDSDPEWSAADELTIPYDAEIIGLIYNQSSDPFDLTRLTVFRPGEFAHLMSEPDPVNWWRGASWITSVLNDVTLEGQINDHQAKFFQRAATPNMVIKMDATKTPDEVRAFKTIMETEYAGLSGAFRNMYLGGGTDIQVVGMDFSKIGFNNLRASIENATAMRSRVHPAVLGTGASLEGSTINQGNFEAARSLMARGWFCPRVEAMCESLEVLTTPPKHAQLGTNLDDVLFFQTDVADAAKIAAQKTQAIRTLVDSGFLWKTAVKAIAPEWSSTLGHSGKFSVQVQDDGGSEEGPDKGTHDSTPAGDLRALMGRLGRVSDPADIDISALTANLGADSAILARNVIEQHPTSDIANLRAEMALAFREEIST